MLQQNTKLTSFEPHLHAPGTRMCLEAIWGYNIQTLSCVGYDHNWVRGYSYADDVAPLLPKGTILHIVGYMNNTPTNKNVPDPRNWQGSGNRSIANMFIDLGNRVALTDEQFQERDEGAHRREPRQGHHPGLPALRGRGASSRPRVRPRTSSSSNSRGPSGPSPEPGKPLASPVLFRPDRIDIMKKHVRALLTALALVVAPAVAGAQSLSYNSGQNVAPGYEGWEEDADGSKYFLFGYMNRNWEEELDVPVGPTTASRPAAPTRDSRRTSCRVATVSCSA